jgi:uncharacterized protein
VRAKARLEALLCAAGDVAVAVSGGIDSMTLATLAHRAGGTARMMHAISPAVPAEATERVRAHAVQEGWRLDVLDAGEFSDPDYRRNPVNRCFYCKTNLYAAIRRRTDRLILSGANLDDLGDYRPGLDAARAHNVRHPFVEAGIDKAAVRALARLLGLGHIAELPASPCLASRVETGIRIEANSLRSIHAVERLVSSALDARTVRCRLRASGVVIELDEPSYAKMSSALADDLRQRIARTVAADLGLPPISFSPYRRGSAFLLDEA